MIEILMVRKFSNNAHVESFPVTTCLAMSRQTDTLHPCRTENGWSSVLHLITFFVFYSMNITKYIVE